MLHLSPETTACRPYVPEIEAFVHDGDEPHAKLVEVDENLQRVRLSPAQHAATIARCKEPLSAESADNSRSRSRPVSFVTDTQEKAEESDRRTGEHLVRSDALGSDLHAVIGTSLHKVGEQDIQ